MTAVTGDPDLPGHHKLTRRLTDPDGRFAILADQIPAALHAGPPGQIAAHLAGQFGQGVERVVISVAAGNWFRRQSW